MKNLLVNLVAVSSLIIVLGCSGDQVAIENAVNTESNAYLANTIANIEIEGMACEVMCGGKIKEGLSGIEGIVSCDLDFDNKLATVKFDNKTTSKDEMINVIQELNSGQFKVISSNEKSLDSSSEDVLNSNSAEQSVEVISTTDFHFPNIIDALIEML